MTSGVQVLKYHLSVPQIFHLFWSGHGHTGLGQQCHSKPLTQHAQGPLAPQEQQKANSLQGQALVVSCLILGPDTRAGVITVQV